MVRREVREEKGQDLDLFVVNSYGSLAQVSVGGCAREVVSGRASETAAHLEGSL